METRANFVLVGAFALAGFVGLLLFFLWFARFELDRQFAYYDAEFSEVSGLTNASEVRFGGLPVGQVVDVGLAPDGSGLIRVRIEVAADTPVRTSSVAVIETLGVTGVSYVSISAGDPRDPQLSPTGDERVPVIPSGRSALQTISEDAPTIIEEVLAISRQVGELVGPENQARVSAVLENLESSTADLGKALTDFSTVADTIATSSEEIVAFTARLEEISAAAVSALAAAESTLADVAGTARRAEQSLAKGDALLDSGRSAFDSAGLFLDRELPRLAADLTETAEVLRQRIDQVGAESGAALEEFRKTGAQAADLIADARRTLATTETTLGDISGAVAAVEGAATGFDALLEQDGTALIADARTLIADAGRVVDAASSVAETDLPAILEDIRTATDTAARVVEEVGSDLSDAAGRADAISADVATTLDSVSQTFAAANETLGRLNGALETGDAALSAADRAFASADLLMTDDLRPMIAQLRETLGTLDTTIGQVAQDVPSITQDLRRTAESASAAFDEIGRTASGVGPPLRAFATEGLPQYSHLARQARALVDNLDRLVTRMERDPARYFLGGEQPVFRR